MGRDVGAQATPTELCTRSEQTASDVIEFSLLPSASSTINEYQRLGRIFDRSTSAPASSSSVCSHDTNALRLTVNTEPTKGQVKCSRILKLSTEQSAACGISNLRSAFPHKTPVHVANCCELLHPALANGTGSVKPRLGVIERQRCVEA